MFGMGFTEILLIAIVAVIVLGPEKLPQAMMEIAKFIRAAKRTVADAQNSIEQELHISDLKKEALSYKEQLHSAHGDLSRMTGIEGIKEDMGDVNRTLTEAIKAPIADFNKEDEIQEEVKPEEPIRETITFEKKKKPPVEPVLEKVTEVVEVETVTIEEEPKEENKNV